MGTLACHTNATPDPRSTDNCTPKAHTRAQIPLSPRTPSSSTPVESIDRRVPEHDNSSRPSPALARSLSRCPYLAHTRTHVPTGNATKSPAEQLPPAPTSTPSTLPGRDGLPCATAARARRGSDVGGSLSCPHARSCRRQSRRRPGRQSRRRHRHRYRPPCSTPPRPSTPQVEVRLLEPFQEAGRLRQPLHLKLVGHPVGVRLGDA